jgi:hypothetical protein
MKGWTVTNSPDSVVFETLEPLCEGGGLVGGFRLSNNDPNCFGIGRWTAGTDSGTVAGPLPVSSGIALPDEYALAVYPNPFNPSTQLEFALPEAAKVQIRVFDITGRLVEHLTDGFYAAGTHRVTFNASSLPSGLYFARIQANDFTASRKLMLVK